MSDSALPPPPPVSPGSELPPNDTPAPRWAVRLATERVVWNLDEVDARQVVSANEGSQAFAYHPLEEPVPGALPEHEHDQRWLAQMAEQLDEVGLAAVPKEQAVSAGLDALHAHIDQTVPEAADHEFLAPPEFESKLPTHSHEWRELMFRPGMSAAMMYVLYPVVQAAVMDAYANEDDLIRDLRTWWEMTFPQRDAMVAIMEWVEGQVGRPDSQLPPELQERLARAYGSYENHEPEVKDDQD